MGVRTYAPDQVHVTLNGIPVTGFADDTFVKVTADEAAYSKTVGADGEVSRARSVNRAGMLEMTLAQTSAFNDVLSAFALADEASNAGVFSVQIVETGSGRTIINCVAAWIEKWPDLEFSKTVENRVWQIAMSQINWFIGGNASSSGVQ